MSSHFRLLAILDANLVAPRNVQVVLVDEPGTLSELQRRKGHVRRGRRQFPRAVTGGAKAELIEVDAFPTHRDLEGHVRQAGGDSWCNGIADWPFDAGELIVRAKDGTFDSAATAVAAVKACAFGAPLRGCGA